MDKDLEIVDKALCDWVETLGLSSPYRKQAIQALELLRNHQNEHVRHGNTYVYVFPNATQPSPQAPHMPSWPYAPYHYLFVS